MKNKSTLAFTFFCICLMSINTMAYTLPTECKKILDKEFSGWKMSEPLKAVAEYYTKKKIKNPTNLITGDWNGDKKQDYAVIIEHGTEVVDGNSMPKIMTIAFVKTAKGYSHFKLDYADYIQTIKKGRKDFNAETNKGFIHKTDAILTVIWEKSGTAYIWEKGKFKSIITSD